MRLWMIGLVLCVVVGCGKDGDGTAKGSGTPVAAPGSAAPAPAAPVAGSAAAPVAIPAPPPAALPAPVVWKEGDKMQGKWSDGRWYNGRISAVNSDGTYNIKYDDGDVSNRFGKERIRARGTVSQAVGGQSHAGGNTNNAPCPGPGITRRCGGVCVNLQEDSNNCGSCGNRCQSGKHCDGHLFCRDAQGNL